MEEDLVVKDEMGTRVVAMDKPGPGGACHMYQVEPSGLPVDQDGTPFAVICFQIGPIQEVGVNGCTNEDLIMVLRHRLQGFQNGDYKCRENALAITKLEEALHWLLHRTADRVYRGVEGTMEK